MHPWRRSTPLVSPNIINMIDVMLILVVLLFMAASFGDTQVTSMSVDLPDAETATSVPATPFILELYADGKIVVNKQAVSQADLQKMVSDVMQANPDITVAICAERAVRYEQLVTVIDSVRKSGVSNVALAARLIPEKNTP